MTKAQTKFLASLDGYVSRNEEAMPVYPRESVVVNELEAAGVVAVVRRTHGWFAKRAA